MAERANNKTETKAKTRTKNKNKKEEGPVLYVVKQKNKWNLYNSILLLDQEGHFRGTAIFQSKKEAAEYLQRYDQLMKSRGRTVKLKIDKEHTLPPVNKPAYILSSQQPQMQQPQQTQEQDILN